MGRILAKIENSNLPRIQINDLINDWVFSARDRKILRLKLLDGLTYEQVAERVSLSHRQVERIVKEYICDVLKPHM